MSEAIDARGRPRDLFHTLVRVLFLAAGLAVLFWFLFTIQRVLLVFILALILALAINAPVTALEKRGVKRGFGLLIVVLALAAVAGGLGALVVPRLADELPTLAEEVPTMVAGIAELVSGVFGDSPEIDRQISRLVDWVVDSARDAWQHVGAIAAVVVLTLFVVAMVLYMVANPRPLLRGYLRAMPPHLREPGTRAFARGSKPWWWGGSPPTSSSEGSRRSHPSSSSPSWGSPARSSGACSPSSAH
jgi:putative permease